MGQYFTAARPRPRSVVGRRLVEHGELAVLRHREHGSGASRLADAVALAQVAVDDDPPATTQSGALGMPASATQRLVGGSAGGARLGELHDHLRVVVAVGVGRLGELERSQSRSSTEKIALSCIMAKAAPTQRWRPAPNGIQLHGLATSSSRGSR